MTKKQKPKRVRKPRNRITKKWGGVDLVNLEHELRISQIAGADVFISKPGEARRVANWLNRWADWREQQETEGRG